MKAFKIELLIIDHDGIGAEETASILENMEYPNHCIYPEVKNIVEKDIGKWSDDHPLNQLGDIGNAEYARLFHSRG